MSRFDLVRTRQGLEACLHSLHDVRPRFADCPSRVLGYFLEGHWETIHPSLYCEGAAAEFLKLPREHVARVESVIHYAGPPRPQSGPYCVYLPDDGSVRTPDAEGALGREVRALEPVFAALVTTLNDAPAGALSGRLPEVASWWEALVHLAVHFPTTFNKACRLRWAAHATTRGEILSHKPEELLQFRVSPPFEDVVPGLVWTPLTFDVIRSSIDAVKSLLDYTARPEPKAAAPGAFADLHERFKAVGRWAAPAGDAEWSPYPRLLKVASTFEARPAAEWCDFPMGTAFGRLLLGRCNADAEYLLHRGTPAEVEELWADAGAALPESIADEAVMFSSAIRNEYGGYTRGVGCGPAYLNPDPKARWVRFVFNTLRGGGVELRFRPNLQDPERTGLPLFGDAVLSCDIASASALAIEKAGLLGRPAAVATPAPPAKGPAKGPPMATPPKKPKRVRQPKPLSTHDRRIVDLWNSGEHDGTYKGVALTLGLVKGAAKVRTVIDRVRARERRQAKRDQLVTVDKPTDN